MLTILAQNGDGANASGAIVQLLFFALLIGGLFYFLIIRPQRTRARRHQELVSSLEVGDEVQTIGGILGTIEYMDDETVVLQTEGGGRLRVLRRALGDKVRSES